MRRLTVVLLAWTSAVAVLALILGGGRVAPCLGLAGSGAQLDCIARWEAAHQPASPLLDPAMPWLWLGVWLAGCVVVVSAGGARD